MQMWDRQLATPPQLQRPDVCSLHTQHWANMQPSQKQPRAAAHAACLCPACEGARHTHAAATARRHGILHCRSPGLRVLLPQQGITAHQQGTRESKAMGMPVEEPAGASCDGLTIAESSLTVLPPKSMPSCLPKK